MKKVSKFSGAFVAIVAAVFMLTACFSDSSISGVALDITDRKSTRLNSSH